MPAGGTDGSVGTDDPRHPNRVSPRVGTQGTLTDKELARRHVAEGQQGPLASLVCAAAGLLL